eukprot:6102197-Prymnesium_polylepis.1
MAEARLPAGGTSYSQMARERISERMAVGGAHDALGKRSGSHESVSLQRLSRAVNEVLLLQRQTQLSIGQLTDVLGPLAAA